MKREIRISVLVIGLLALSFVMCQAQSLSLPEIPKKGRVVLKDGTKLSFHQNLTVRNDSVFITVPGQYTLSHPSQEILKITKKRRLVGEGVALGSAYGLYRGVKENINLSDSGEKMKEISKQLVIWAAVGGLIGFAIPVERTIYRNNMDLTFKPTINLDPNCGTVAQLTCRVSIH